MKMPEISVGILSENDISFSLNGTYSDNSGILKYTGRWKATLTNDKIVLSNGKKILEAGTKLLLSPDEYASGTFVLHSVTIGKQFHWQRNEDQTFGGSLKIVIEEGRLTAINILPLEDYLTSVISSEMSAASSLELLKAHAIVSRSWLLAQLEKKRNKKTSGGTAGFLITENEICRWYDREDHSLFDVCADDHCQRYQGVTRVSTDSVIKAISSTEGEVLSYKGKVCDTRYYKCCGGVTELYGNVWEAINVPYLQPIRDNTADRADLLPDLCTEEAARKWIDSRPEAFCNSNNREVLEQVLNDYDFETLDFFRWKVIYSDAELSEIVKEKTGKDPGIITSIIPLQRGSSGRISRLRLEGTKGTLIIGKELEIRKALSRSHLYSSCFYVSRGEANGETIFTFHGAGWGHGVGLCQIGAAVMGSKGYSYREILKHYFKNARIEKIY